MVGSPASAVTLYLYAKSIKKYGPQFTLRLSEIICFLLLSLMFIVSSRIKGLSGQISVVVFYAFREIYVSLISTQQWAFIASTLTASTSSFMVHFSGIVSIASAIGGCMIEPLVNRWGVRGQWLTIYIRHSITNKHYLL
jgi:hypothetical protein